MTDLNLSNILSNIERQSKEPGLYIIATPIGNMLDITLRGLFILDMADLVLAEDTRITRKLLTFYGISKKVISYNDHSDLSVAMEAANLMECGKTVALVSDAGTPLVSDPGYTIVRECKKRQITITSIPGPCSVINAVVLSGLPVNNFYFHGFLPYKSAARKKILASLIDYDTLLIFFESPYRVCASLNDMLEVFGDVEISLSREMTKKFEETTTDHISNIISKANTTKGEFVIIINNKKNNKENKKDT